MKFPKLLIILKKHFPKPNPFSNVKKKHNANCVFFNLKLIYLLEHINNHSPLYLYSSEHQTPRLLL
jgi:hypothetical protein